ncbi:hypothetical protein IWW36_003206 [Coemansia brasiliensis]|uniref:Uncharacterized protein n=1 Tax=Coemansia brasiliensis TaxID=2650707 RepID=A0A9W8I5M7_9FUNG|nr:hypothetical protein IWW36_003206 [Coemansia brasiliensis]
MGLREKTEVDLQVVSLGWVLVTLLVLAAARRYTSNWRERRRFRRHLATTQQRLAPTSRTTQEDASGSNTRPQGTRWKRFVAAAPLVPLATAYVAVRVGWDIFQVVVFCLIDFAREAAGSAAVCAYTGWQAARSVWQGLMLRRRAADLCVVVVESTVGWLFSSAFPAAARAFESAAHLAHIAAAWWVDYGGPALRDGIEFVVLDGLVPAASFAARASAAVCARAQWLAVRIGDALMLVVVDVATDVSALYQWTVSDLRWWRDPRIRSALLQGVWWQQEQLHRTWAFLADHVLPGMESLIVWAYVWVLRPLATLVVDIGDWLLQAALESGVRLSAAALALGTAVARLWRILVRYCRWLRLRFGPGLLAVVALLRHGLVGYARSVAGWCMQTVSVCSAVYMQVHDLMLVPMFCAAMNGAALIWRLLGAADPYLRAAWALLAGQSRDLLCRLFASVRLVSRHLELVLLRVASLAQQHLRHAAQAWGAAFMRWLLTGHSLIAPRVAQMGAAGLDRLSYEFARLWPRLQHAGREGSRAMADVYEQLVALVDALVGIAGDLIVDYARRNAQQQQQQQPNSSRSNDHSRTQLLVSKEKSA